MGKVKQVETLGAVRDGHHELEAICRYSGCRHRCRVDLDRTIQSVGAAQPVLPVRSDSHFTDQMRCPACKRRGMNLWLLPVAEKPRSIPPSVPAKEPNYRVINHGRHHPYDFQMIATADNLFVGKAAYAAASHFYGEHWLTLMQGAFVIDDNRRDGQPEIMTEDQYRHMRAIEGGGRPSGSSAAGTSPEPDAKTL